MKIKFYIPISMQQFTNVSTFQEIAARFFTTGASLDFIPINSGPQFPALNVEMTNTGKGKKRKKVTNQANNKQVVIIHYTVNIEDLET